MCVRHRAVAVSATLLLGLLASRLPAGETWFDEDYSGLDAATWTDTAGTWTRGAADASSFDAVNRIVNVSTDEALEFAPKTAAASARVTVIEAATTFESMAADDFPETDGKQAALILQARPGGGYAFFGLTRNGFVRLGSAGLVPEPDRLYALRFEMDYREVPATVRYVLDGVPLVDAEGNVRFAALGSARRVAALGVTGVGRLGTFRGEQDPADRATVAPDLSRPRVGRPIACAVTTNADAVLTGELRYRWRVTRWDGAGTDETVSTAATYVPTAADYGKWIVAEAYDDEGYVGGGRMWFSRLPVAYIDVEGNEWPTAAKEEHDAVVRILGNDEFKDQYDNTTSIKVRGNSTAGLPKKPYKLKLAKKADLFGLGGGTKNKHWVLLANYYDESLMRDKLAYDFSASFGLTYMKSTWVDVIFNGQYNGNYLICQHIRVGEDRVDIFDWEDEMEERGGVAEDLSSVDAATEDVSGGYLFEMSNEYDELSKFVVTSETIRVATMLNKPEYLYTNPGMMAAAKSIWQDFWDACTSPNGYNASGKHYSELADVDSLVGFFLTMEIFRNNDASYKSRYAYKDRGEPIRFGPVWDFDWGFGSPIIRKNAGAEPDPTGWCVATAEGIADLAGDKSIRGAAGFYKEWLDDPWFCRKAYDAYWRVRPEMERLVADGGTVDGYIGYLAESGAANEGRWFFYTGFSGETGDAKWVKEFLRRRFAWLDAQFASVETFMASVKTAKSAAPYARSDDPAAGFPVSVPGETGPVSNVTVAAGGDVPATVASGCAAEVRVAVNGICVGRVSVAGGTGALRIPSAAFTAPSGAVNTLALDAYGADGVLVARNYAWVKAETATPGEVPVAFAWINRHYPDVTNNAWGAALPEDYAKLATALDENGLSPLGKSVPFAYDYLAGTDPARKDHFFRATIKVGADGVVEVRPDPDLGDSRVYTLLGKETLDGGDDWKVADETSRFFKLKVDLK